MMSRCLFLISFDGGARNIMPTPTPDRPWRALYNQKRWVRRSRAQIAAHPECAMCLEEDENNVVSARVADHVIPHRGDLHLFWFGKLQSLCTRHHNASKQQLETKGYTDNIGNDGFPLDPMHPFNRLKKNDDE